MWWVHLGVRIRIQLTCLDLHRSEQRHQRIPLCTRRQQVRDRCRTRHHRLESNKSGKAFFLSFFKKGRTAFIGIFDTSIGISRTKRNTPLVRHVSVCTHKHRQCTLGNIITKKIIRLTSINSRHSIIIIDNSRITPNLRPVLGGRRLRLRCRSHSWESRAKLIHTQSVGSAASLFAISFAWHVASTLRGDCTTVIEAVAAVYKKYRFIRDCDREER